MSGIWLRPSPKSSLLSNRPLKPSLIVSVRQNVFRRRDDFPVLDAMCHVWNSKKPSAQPDSLAVGKDSVVMGHVAPNTKVGDQSVVVGATD
jgi:hypothetical protein